MFENELNKGKYKIKSFKKNTVIITSGTTPKSGGEAYTEDKENGIPFIRSGEIGKKNFKNALHIKSEIHNTVLKSSQLKKGDLLIAIVGATIGEIGVFNSENEGNINQAIALVRLKETIIPEYAMFFLKSIFGKTILDKIKRPVARANINLDEIGTISIPVPPIEIQEKINLHIKNIHKQAQTLKDKSKLALQQANIEIENLLLN